MAFAVRLTRGGGVWAAFALLALLAPALATGVGWRPAIDWRPGVWLIEPWRLWSAAWVHFSDAHLAANALGALLVGALGIAARLPSRAAAAWALAWPVGHAVLALQPQLASYGGLSGVLHAGVAVVGTWLLRDNDGRRHAVGAALLSALALKVLLEAPWRAALPHSAVLGIATVPLAHAGGAIAGTIAALLFSARRLAR